MPAAPSVDAYIAALTPEPRARMARLRALVRKIAPKAAEAIKYGMPTWVLEGNVFSLGAYKQHIGMYPAPSPEGDLKDSMAPYLAERATLRFPASEPMPWPLIEKLIRLRFREHAAWAAAKQAKSPVGRTKRR